MAQGQNLQMNVCSIVKAGTERGEKATNHSNHGRRSLSPEWCNRNVFSADEVYGMHSRNPVQVRSCQYLNNVVEQDHRRVKGRLRPMLGFKTFYNARRVIIGIELAQKIHKRQFAIPISLQSNPAEIWRHVMAA